MAGAAQNARDIRERTRPKPDGTTAVTGSQATELTLTLTEAAVRPIQIWVRTAGTIDRVRKTVTALVPRDEAALLRVGQRVRAFSPESRSRMYQARVAAVTPRGACERGPQPGVPIAPGAMGWRRAECARWGAGGVEVRAALLGESTEAATRFVLEIVTERGDFLSVPNEAIIETGGKRIVYVAQPGGGYAPRDVTTGVHGELFTEVRDGLRAGEQVVTIGSFFIDAEYRLKATP